TDKTPTNIASFEAEIFKLCDRISDSYVKKHFLNFFKQKFFEYGRWAKPKSFDNHKSLPKISDKKQTEIYKLEQQILYFVLSNYNLLALSDYQQEVCDLEFSYQSLDESLKLFQDNIEKIQEFESKDYRSWLVTFLKRFSELESKYIKLEIDNYDKNNAYSSWQKMLKLYFLANIRKEYEALVVSDQESDVKRAQTLLAQIASLQNEINNF
ncbi:MAG: hypothetical protein ISQ32_05105, partial [Rickettsiales bacterium]|nr:hypothetical protein [Rickettsiales bacterium]